MNSLVELEECRNQQLLGTEQLDDCRPTQFLRNLQKLLGEKATFLDTAILRELFLQRLPASIRMSLATAHIQPPPQLTELSDRLL